MMNDRSVLRRWRGLLPMALVLLALAGVGGCNIVGPLGYVMAPEPTVEAQYVLPDRPTVVFVDDRQNLMNPAALRRSVADRTSEILLGEEALTEMIAPRDAMAYASTKDRHGNLLAIEEVGEAVEAEQVIYVEITGFAASVDGYSRRPRAEANVKVIDVVEREVLFPDESMNIGAVPVRTVFHRELPAALYQSRSSLHKVHEAVALELGADIARLFFEHRPKDALGERLQPR